MRGQYYDETKFDTPFYFGYSRNGRVTIVQAKRLPARVTIPKEIVRLAVESVRKSDYPRAKAYRIHFVKALRGFYKYMELREAVNKLEDYLDELYPGRRRTRDER